MTFTRSFRKITIKKNVIYSYYYHGQFHETLGSYLGDIIDGSFRVSNELGVTPPIKCFIYSILFLSFGFIVSFL